MTAAAARGATRPALCFEVMEGPASDSPGRPAPTPHVSVQRRFGTEGEVRCSFCWKPSSAVRRMVGGPGEGPNQVFICDECVALCAEIMAEMG